MNDLAKAIPAFKSGLDHEGLTPWSEPQRAPTRRSAPRLKNREFMANTQTNLEEAIRQAAGQYYRLVILAGLPGRGKTATLRSVSETNGCRLVNVNLELSRLMLELARAQRPLSVERLLRNVIAAVPGDLVLLDNLEILFDASLEVEPLRLLQVASRNRTVVASWNGTFKDGTLTYAEPGHPEFTQFKRTEAVVIAAHEMSGH